MTFVNDGQFVQYESFHIVIIFCNISSTSVGDQVTTHHEVFIVTTFLQNDLFQDNHELHTLKYEPSNVIHVGACRFTTVG